MAIGKKTGGRDFLPGQVNPGAGRPKTPDYLKELRKARKIEIDIILLEMVVYTKDQLLHKLDDPNTSGLELCLCSAMYHCIKKGDIRFIMFVFERILGKISPDEKSHYEEATVKLLYNIGDKPKYDTLES